MLQAEGTNRETKTKSGPAWRFQEQKEEQMRGKVEVVRIVKRAVARSCRAFYATAGN